MSKKSSVDRALAVTGRIAGTVVLVTAVGFVGYWGLVPAPVPTTAVAPLGIEVAPGLQSSACPGQLILPPADATNPSFNPAPVPAQGAARIFAADGGDLQVGQFGTDVPLTPGQPQGLEAAGELLVDQDTSAGLWAQLTPGAEPIQPTLTGLSYSLVTDGDARGLAVGQCASPTTDTWLIGGSTVVGNTTHLVLQNPSATTAQVEVQVWGANGKVERPGSTVILNPGTSRELDLGGLAPNQRRTAVRVLTSGAAINSYLQHTQLQGFTPQGTDWVQGSDAPAATQVVTGLNLEESELGSGQGAVLRLLSPDVSATVSLTFYDEEGQARVPGLSSVELVAGEVLDVALDGLAEGSWSIVAQGTAPITGGALVPRTGLAGDLDATQRRDTSWIPARNAPTQSQLFAFDPQWNTSLTLFAPAAPATATWVELVQRTPSGTELNSTKLNVAGEQTQRVTLTPADSTEAAIFELQVPLGLEMYASFEVSQVQPDGEVFSVLTPLPSSTDGGLIKIIDPAMGH